MFENQGIGKQVSAGVSVEIVTNHKYDCENRPLARITGLGVLLSPILLQNTLKGT
jgi:hypothetical protein